MNIKRAGIYNTKLIVVNREELGDIGIMGVTLKQDVILIHEDFFWCGDEKIYIHSRIYIFFYICIYSLYNIKNNFKS